MHFEMQQGRFSSTPLLFIQSNTAEKKECSGEMVSWCHFSQSHALSLNVSNFLELLSRLSIGVLSMTHNVTQGLQIMRVYIRSSIYFIHCVQSVWIIPPFSEQSAHKAVFRIKQVAAA